MVHYRSVVYYTNIADWVRLVKTAVKPRYGTLGVLAPTHQAKIAKTCYKGMLNVSQDLETEFIASVETWIGQRIDPPVTHLDLRRFKIVSSQPVSDIPGSVVPHVNMPIP